MDKKTILAKHYKEMLKTVPDPECYHDMDSEEYLTDAQYIFQAMDEYAQLELKKRLSFWRIVKEIYWAMAVFILAVTSFTVAIYTFFFKPY